MVRRTFWGLERPDLYHHPFPSLVHYSFIEVLERKLPFLEDHWTVFEQELVESFEYGSHYQVLRKISEM